MIGYVQGTVLAVTGENSCILKTGEIGYEITFRPKRDKLVEGAELSLFCYEKISEDDRELFGFETLIEREIFKILIKIQGVGPRIAYSIVSQLTVEELLAGIQQGRPEIFSKVKGVGAKTSEKLVFELKNFLSSKVSDIASRFGVVNSGEEVAFAIQALERLGIQRNQAVSLIERARLNLEKAGQGLTIEGLVAEGLRLAK